MTKEQIRDFTLRTTQSNHSGLILVMFDVEHVYLTDAITSYEQDNIEDYLKNVELARKVLNELMASFDMRNSLSRRVVSILRFIYKQLVVSLVKREPQELDRCINMMDNLRNSFVPLHEQDDEGPIMKNTHQVYAGLTYGKGVLNESIEGVNYSSRGFRA